MAGDEVYLGVTKKTIDDTVCLDNNEAYQAKDSSGTARNIAKINTSDELEIGDGGLTSPIKFNQPVIQVEYDSWNTTKQIYSDWTTIRTKSFTAEISGTVIVWWAYWFGFDTSAVTAFFRILLNGTQIAYTQKLNSPASERTPGRTLIGKYSVSAGNTLSFEFQTNGEGDDYYVQDNHVVIMVVPT